MSLIKNLIKESEHKPPKFNKKGKNKDDDEEDNDKEEPKVRPIIKSATDLQRLKVEKLMKNPEKPVMIPEQRRERDHLQTVPSFVRNVMGSSAGAGSGEFHVYRHLRRKEYARQKTIESKSAREKLDDDYQHKLEENLRKAEEKTAKKRAKRLKRKHRTKQPRLRLDEDKLNDLKDQSESSSHDSDEGGDIGGDSTKKEATSGGDATKCPPADEGIVAAEIEEPSSVAKDSENVASAEKDGTQRDLTEM